MKVPVTFDVDGCTYGGTLSRVSGSGNNILWHLIVENYYRGALFYTDCWQFYGNRFTGIGEDLGAQLIAFCDAGTIQLE